MSTASSSGPEDSAMRTTQVPLWSVGIIWSTKLRNPPQSGAKRNKSESKCSQNANLASRLALWCSGSDKHCTVDMSTAISSGPKDFGIMTTQVQLWSVGIIWSTELRNLPQSGAKRNKSESKSSQNANLASRLALWCAGSDKCCPVDMVQSTEHPNPPQPGAKRNESESKSTENAILGGRCQRRSLPAPRIAQSKQHRCNCGPWGSSGAPNCEIRCSLRRRGMNRSQKALKMPFWVADVNGDLFRPRGFRNHDNTRVIVVRGDHLEHRTAKSAAVWGEEE
ncbi:hypothetical protein R3P38DRAFT_2779654 [Favolaschia claudopus]|uniref:Uncharacterized protein n=1 Tax=Favolaschia claudopus TaxID=2862362 RepID=A0AAW0BE24_9AGAR